MGIRVAAEPAKWARTERFKCSFVTKPRAPLVLALGVLGVLLAADEPIVRNLVLGNEFDIDLGRVDYWRVAGGLTFKF